MSDKIKEYGWSSITTFVAAFAFAIAPLVGGAPLDKAALFAIVMVGVRAGTKAVFQYIASGKVGAQLGARF
jgi:hypothetical protein